MVCIFYGELVIRRCHKYHIHDAYQQTLDPKCNFFRSGSYALTSSKQCTHPFFECVVAKAAWSELKLCAGSVITVVDINSLTKFWDTKRDNSALNMIHAGFLWVLWLTRNDMYFKRDNWSGMQVVWRRLVCTISLWGILLTFY
jgi:hypothetical protein